MLMFYNKNLRLDMLGKYRLSRDLKNNRISLEFIVQQLGAKYKSLANNA